MGFEVIIIGAIAGFFVIRQIMKADEQGGQDQATSSVISSFTFNSDIPEDSTLRRHYLQTLEAERLAITHPYPTEFNLKRHVQSAMENLLVIPEQSEAKPKIIAKPVKAVRKTATAKATTAKEPKKVTEPEKVDSKPKPKPKAAPKPKAESKPKAEPKPKVKTAPKLKDEPKPKAKPAKTKSESKSE